MTKCLENKNNHKIRNLIAKTSTSLLKKYKNKTVLRELGGVQMKEREEQFRKIQESYDSFTFMFYEAMRRNSHYTFKDLDKQIDKTIEELQKLKRI